MYSNFINDGSYNDGRQYSLEAITVTSIRFQVRNLVFSLQTLETQLQASNPHIYSFQFPF